MTDIIGRTKSGKPVYALGEPYPDFDARDHYDADVLHANQLSLARTQLKLAERDRALGIPGAFNPKEVQRRIRRHRAASQMHLRAAIAMEPARARKGAVA